MIGHARLLAALLALSATVGTADAQSVSLSPRRLPRASLSLAFGNPYFARSRPRQVAPRRIWVAGHRERAQRRVWVNGGYRREWVPPIYDVRVDTCGRTETVMIRNGHWGTVEQAGHFETRWVEVWVDGYWKLSR